MSAPTGKAAELPIRWLRCACCGESVRGRQWSNRDTGYGGCERCADWHRERYGEGSAEEFAANPLQSTAYAMFGERGVHFAIPCEDGF